MLITLFNGDFEYWDLKHKVTFDGENKLILINTGETILNVEIDIYSDWKEWSRVRDNTKFEQALTVVGGDPSTGGDRLEPTFFLINGWKIRTWEGDHNLLVNGNLFTDNQTSLFIPTIFPHNISINLKVTNLININYDVDLNNATLPAAVWDVLVEEHVIADSFAEKIRKNLTR